MKQDKIGKAMEKFTLDYKMKKVQAENGTVLLSEKELKRRVFEVCEVNTI